MSYKDTYQQAMEKVCTNDAWKQQTLEKMRAEQQHKPCFIVWKKAALSAAALAVIVGTVLVNQNQQQKAADSIAGTNESVAASPYIVEENLGNIPKVARMQQDESLPLIHFSTQSLQEVSQTDLPFEINLSNSAKMLPVWQKIEEEWIFLGDYPLISSTDAAALTEGDFQQSDLIYVDSNGYLQPVYHFISKNTDISDLYIPALYVEYYE